MMNARRSISFPPQVGFPSVSTFWAKISDPVPLSCPPDATDVPPNFNAFLARHPLPAARTIHRYTSWNESLA
jgi:hypothetical protein